MNNDKKEGFSYTYSATQQEEIKSIREKYQPREESKMEQLRKLDESVTMQATMISLVVGIISTLVLGVGMCCVLVWTNYFALGIVVGIVGMAGMGLAYPVFCSVTKKQREKLAPQILKLTDELMQQK